VQSDTGLASLSSERVAEHRQLLEELGGEYRETTGSDIAAALINVAQTENATQIVLGASRRSKWRELTQGSVINRVIRLAGTIDVHVISADDVAGGGGGKRLPVTTLGLTPLPPRRRALGWLLATAGLPLLTLLLANMRDQVGLHSVLLLYLISTMAIAAVGGVFPALAAVVAGFLLANWYFTPPYYRWSIADGENVLALIVFVAAAGIVSVLVDRLGRSQLEASRAKAEAEAMAALAGSLAEEEALPALIGNLRTTFGMQSAALFRRDAQAWRLEAAAGSQIPDTPDDADVVKIVNDDLVLALGGGRLVSDDHRVLNAFAAQLAAAVEARRLQLESARATGLEQANELRNALLQAVSHDLRTPLASIKASISSIRQRDVPWSADELEVFHTTIEEETDRLNALVTNLLDMSRLQAGALTVLIRPVGLEEVVPAAVASLGERGRSVLLDIPETLPPVAADAALLERAIANVLDNAVSASPPDQPVRVEAFTISGRVDLCVIDRGGGIPREHREEIFQPFQRLADHGTGVGLGLAITRGFVTAMNGELSIDDTPGGGVTLVISLPEAAS
jgi:two-component system sensor histidine kinase KdpD